MGKHQAISWQPRLLGHSEAAAYLGISSSTLRSLPIPRRELGSRRLYDRMDLDRYASDLPYEGEETSEVETCDNLFGVKP